MIKRSLLGALLLALSAGIAWADGNTAIYDPVTGIVCSSSNACPWLGGGTAGTPSIVTQSAPANDRIVAPVALTAVAQTLAVNSQGASTVEFKVTANTNITLAFDGLGADGTNWVQNINAYPLPSGAAVTGVSSSATGDWIVPAGGFQQVRARVTVAGATPTATVSAEASSGDNLGPLNLAAQSAVPAGTNHIGEVSDISQADAGNITPVAGEGTGTCSSTCGNVALWTLDTTGYLGTDISVTSAGSATTITYECSQDNLTWGSCSYVTWTANGSAGCTSTSTTAINGTLANVGRYVRARISTYGSGTVTATYSLRRNWSSAIQCISWNSNPNVTVSAGTDPCASQATAKSSAAINITSATTTQLVAISGSTTIYVCGFSMSIAPSATAADSAQFEYGTSTNCTGTNALTGTVGAGDLTTAAPPLMWNSTGSFTQFKSAASNGLCLVSAGTTVNIQGVLTYVQQ